MKDLFGTDISAKEISLLIYCDERIVDSKKHPNKENWIYIILLMIPDSKKPEVLGILNEHRKNIGYYNELKFHKLRKTSRSSTIAGLAKLWLQEIINDTNKRFYFKVLGIKKDNLLFELFGAGSASKGKYANIYNRFFRSAFMGALNSYFPHEEYGENTISGLFHDRQGELEAHEFFLWHLFSKVAGGRISFTSKRVCFIESDHNVEPTYKDDSQLIQLVDLLVGSISHCLDLLTKYNKGKNEVAKIMLPLLRDILGNVRSERSRFDYFRKYDVSFYPSKKLTHDEYSNDINRARSHFFRNRRILLEEHQFGRQLPLLF